MSKAIPALDLMFLLTESANNPKHVGALLTFRPPANAKPGLVRTIVDAYRAADVRAPFTYVADLSLTGAPRWKTTTDLDMHYHVQHIALPAGASREHLLELVADLHEPVLDRNRPGFRAHFIEGLPGGEFAIYLKVHHAIVDGASAMARILASLNVDVTAKRIVPCFGVDLKANRQRIPKGILDRLNSLQLLARRQTAAFTDVSIGALKKGLGAIFRGAPGGSLPFTAPHTLMNEPTHTARRLAMLSLPLADMRAAGNACGGTLNGATPGMFPVSGLMAGVGLNVTLASYAGSMDFGIVANGVAMKRLPDLARHIEDAFAELKSALAPPAPSKKPRRAVGGKATSAAAKSAKRKAKRPA